MTIQEADNLKNTAEQAIQAVKEFEMNGYSIGRSSSFLERDAGDLSKNIQTAVTKIKDLYQQTSQFKESILMIRFSTLSYDVITADSYQTQENLKK